MEALGENKEPEMSASVGQEGEPQEQQRDHHQVVREEQMSERSEVTSFRGSESASRFDEVLDWLDNIPLSRKYYTKSLARDFSDAVLVSEILKFYHPVLVSQHNYIPVNGVVSKKENWNLLNRKVLAKIDMRLSPETIDQLAHSHPGAIERVLISLHEKNQAAKQKDEAKPPPDDIHDDIEKDEADKSIVKQIYESTTSLLSGFLSLFLTVLCFWKWFSRKTCAVQIVDAPDATSHKGTDDSTVDNQMHESYLKALEDLERHWETIKTLRHKVAFLEGSMKIKDAKIASLQCELDGNRYRQRLDASSARKPRVHI